jgi:AAA+ superfamily predicted ATPase
MANNYENNILLGTDDYIFHFTDNEMRFFQVKENNRYQVLIQANSEKDKPSTPQLYDVTVPNAKPVIKGSNWCLDRCVGIVHLTRKGTVFPESDYDFVEVTPSFERIVSEEEGYPPEWIKTRRISQHVDILYPFKRPMEELNRLVGCEDIKRRLIEFKMLAEYNKACERQSPEVPVMQIFLHSIFYGNPGTGKSTVCRLYGSLLKEAGMLSKGHVVVADRKVFTGDCFGDTEDILRELINYSEGGILLFDEAYLLEGTHPNDPNKMVLPMLLSELADTKKKDFAVVLCGYKDKLDRMLEQNPGLYSRFVNRFEFKDYTLDELVEIGVRYLKTVGHTFTIDGLASFRDELASAISGSSKKSWANARSVKNMIEQIYIKRAMRYSKDSTLDHEITSEDITGIPYERRNRIGFFT